MNEEVKQVLFKTRFRLHHFEDEQISDELFVFLKDRHRKPFVEFLCESLNQKFNSIFS
jgi:hypothetical protein